MNRVTETAHAKINLALHVRARRPDGYHEIETLFAFTDGGDGVEVEAAGTLSLDITGPFAKGLPVDEDNLVMQAARAMQRHFGIAAGACIRLEKRLPVAAGLGGGSADAAAVARALNRLWVLDADDAALIAAIGGLGADVAACVSSRTTFGRGIGEQLEPAAVPGLPGTSVLLVNPMKPCLTGPVYRAWDGADRGSLAVHRSAWRNDLTPGAVALVPEIGLVLYVLAEMEGTTQVAMSGSGATCFALFTDDHARDAARDEIGEMYPGWWSMAGRLR